MDEVPLSIWVCFREFVFLFTKPLLIYVVSAQMDIAEINPGPEYLGAGLVWSSYVNYYFIYEWLLWFHFCLYYNLVWSCVFMGGLSFAISTFISDRFLAISSLRLYFFWIGYLHSFTFYMVASHLRLEIAGLCVLMPVLWWNNYRPNFQWFSDWCRLYSISRLLSGFASCTSIETRELCACLLD